MEHNRKLNVLIWNAQGITNFASATQLHQLIMKENVDIVMISETLLKEHHKFHLPGYKIHRKDRTEDRGGGVALAVKSTIKHKTHPETVCECIENISVSVDIGDSSTIFTSIYCPKYRAGLEKDIKKLSRINGKFFIGGDFNARNGAWNCTRNNKAGNVLYSLQPRSNFFVHYPNSPTHFPHSGATPSTIDLNVIHQRHTSHNQLLLTNSCQTIHQCHLR